MDFIKTSSLRALIELTFQRNWNGLIWMSRKGVTTKRVKTVQTALSRISAQPRSPAGRGTMFRARPNLVRPSEVSAKVQTVGRSRHDPGNIARGRPRHATTAHDQSARAGKSLAAAQLSAYHGRCIRPSRETTSRVRPRFHRPIHPPTTPADHDPSDPDRSDSATYPIVRPIVPHDRPNAAVDPKPFLKPKLMFSSPA
ncbi:unnamed protein product [Microthlaspi erraticum]|uniref:Uncharacterized protein n=1 Tax=Microthlaspi erraticum TaxID=1685480 RepID=A0A6D2JGV5_9BRAS|nr:unnamed protein product [Microthlaspi erraticum]